MATRFCKFRELLHTSLQYGSYPDDARAVGSSLLRRHRGQRSGVEGQRIPSELGCRGSGGGGGTGRDVNLLTASLLSAEYHHSSSLSRNTPRGMRLVAIRCKTVIAGGESSVAVSSLICRDNVIPASKRICSNLQKLYS
jgi:hypothetical protein